MMITNRIETIKEVAEYHIGLYEDEKTFAIKIRRAREGDYILGVALKSAEEKGLIIPIENGTRFLHCEVMEPIKQREFVTVYTKR